MSHLSSIGFHVASNENLNDLLKKVYDLGKLVKVDSGIYVQFTDPSGAEIWIQVNKNNELIGLNPHFDGKGEMLVGLMHAVEEQEDPMDGGYYVWANPGDLDEDEAGEFPFVFDLPNFYAVDGFELPAKKMAQLAIFAQQFDYFESADEFAGAQPEEMRMATHSFLPLGLLDQEDEEEKAPMAYVLVNGVVKDCAIKTNELTSQQFQWLLLETLGGTIDVVAPLEVVEETVKVGGVLSVVGWICGRLRSEE